MRTATFLAVVFFWLAAAAAPSANAPPAGDKVLQALMDELPRCLQLKTSAFSPPFHATAEATHDDVFQVSAEFGALESERHDVLGASHGAVLVGTPEVNNSGRAMMANRMGMGQGRTRGTVELDYDAVRHAVWLSCDTDYKQGLDQVAGKKAMLTTMDVHDRPPDLTDAPAFTYLAEPPTLEVNRDRWPKLVKSASAIFRDDPLAYTGSAEFMAIAGTQWVIGTDPFQNRFGYTLFSLRIDAAGQAPDGRDISAQYSISAGSEKELPKDDTLMKAAREVQAQLKALAAAPVLEEDYAGPVLFTGQAAAEFFLSTIAGPLGPGAVFSRLSHQSGFADRRGQHVASKLLTVRDDPGKKAWKGQSLLGYFPVDDDGVKPEAITLIDKGVLKTPYLSRIPAKAGDKSNGHSRAGYGAAGNMFVEAAKPSSKAALKARLIALAKEDDLPSALLVEQVTETGGHTGFGDQLNFPPPLRVWRVYVDGHQELLRNVTFKPVSLRVLTDIDALGSDPTLYNTKSMGQNVSVVAPSVLVRHLDVAKPGDTSAKPPEVPRPVVTAAK